MEIEINDTPDTKDDVVLLKCDRAPHRPTVNCRIRATGSCSQSSTVVLTNPDHRLRFPGAGDTTTTVTVPQDGSWASFQISGEVKSDAIGDAVIEAHCATAAGEKKASKGVTVVWFDQAHITITPGANYGIVGNRYAAAGVAASFSVQARIRPAGVDCHVPQITPLRVAIMQNVPAAMTHRITWGNPTIAWAGAAPSGTAVAVPSQIQFSMSNPALSDDSAASVDPVYDQPGKADTIDANSLKPPNGCTGGGTATSNDTPDVQGPATINFPAQVGGTQVGVVTYRRTRMQIDMDFTTWAAIFNTSDNHFCVLRQANWACHVDSAAAGPQHATATGDADPTSTPVTGAPYFNTNINNAANQRTGPLGAAMTNFLKP